MPTRPRIGVATCSTAPSTWDYPLRRGEFLAWAEGCRRTANPSDVLPSNTDKRYLNDLAAAGVPTVQTVFAEPTGERRAVAEAALDAEPGGRGRLPYARVDLIPG